MVSLGGPIAVMLWEREAGGSGAGAAPRGRLDSALEIAVVTQVLPWLSCQAARHGDQNISVGYPTRMLLRDLRTVFPFLAVDLICQGARYERA
mgnify:CR=1 FL=1